MAELFTLSSAAAAHISLVTSMLGNSMHHFVSECGGSSLVL